MSNFYKSYIILLEPNLNKFLESISILETSNII